MKLCTLLKTEDPKNDTLIVGTSLERKYMGVNLPEAGGKDINDVSVSPMPHDAEKNPLHLYKSHPWLGMILRCPNVGLVGH